MPRGVRRSPVAQATTEPEQTPALSTPSPRSIETRRERRRRDDGDLDGTGRMKLAIPHEVQERLRAEGKTSRWILDDGNRLMATHANDWDKTPGVAAVPAGEGDLKLVLHEKYADWWESDQRKKTVRLDEMDKAIERGEISGDGSNVATEQNQRLARHNRISRG